MDKKYCRKCDSFFEGKAYGKDKMCLACKEAFDRVDKQVKAFKAKKKGK